MPKGRRRLSSLLGVQINWSHMLWCSRQEAAIYSRQGRVTLKSASFRVQVQITPRLINILNDHP